jgi:4-amino-4-deoxy-L-arabinose transferase-like glycosyltransferase
MLNTSAASSAPPFFYGLLGLWLKLTGVGLWEARLFSFILMIAAIVLTVLAARNWYGTKTALLTGVALFASAVLALGGRIRHDIGLAAAVAASLWLFTEAIKRKDKRLHLLAGMAIGFGYFAHTHATFFGVVLAVGFYAPRYFERPREGKRLPETEFWLYVLGGLVAGGTAFALQTLPNLQGFLSNRFTVSTNLQTMGQMIVHNVFQVTTISPLEALLILLGLGTALWRGKLQDWSLVLCIVLGHLALGLDSFRTEYYTVPLTPFYGLVVGSLLANGFSRHNVNPVEGIPPKWLTAVPALAFIMPLLAFTLRTPLTYFVQGQPIHPNPPAPAQWVLDHVSPDKLVIGDHYYFLWLTGYRYGSIGIPELLLPSERAQHSTAGEVWDTLQPDVFIVDPTMSSYVTDGQRLINEDYFESRGFQVAAQFPAGNQTITIYERP